MTQAQADLFARALARAKKDGIKIAGRGTRKADGKTVYAVTSSRADSRCYCVVVDGSTLTCDCKAGQNEQYCKHRSLVTQRFMDEATARKEMERAAHAPARHLDATERDAALLYRPSQAPRIFR